MSICNEKHHDKPSSSRQIFIHVRESETPLRDVRRLILDTLLQYQEIDKIGFSLGGLNKSASFADNISWCSILSKLDHAKDSLDKVSKEHLVKSVDYLDELVSSFNEKAVEKIQQQRDRWMKKVLLWDLVMFGLLLVALVSSTFWSGAGGNLDKYDEFVQQRPFFSFLLMSTAAGMLVGLHFFVRRIMLNNLFKDMQEKLPAGMSLLKALTRNARIQHSIFRPAPVGWNFRQRKRLQAIKENLTGLRQQLEEVLAHYPEQKAA